MTRLGNQVVTFVSYEDSGSAGALGTYTPSETTVDVPGCHHRPMAFRETAEFDVDIATQVWKTTAPPKPAVLAAQAEGEIRVNGVAYKIIGGPRCHVDRVGRPFKVTIISQQLSG